MKIQLSASGSILAAALALVLGAAGCEGTRDGTSGPSTTVDVDHNGARVDADADRGKVQVDAGRGGVDVDIDRQPRDPDGPDGRGSPPDRFNYVVVWHVS